MIPSILQPSLQCCECGNPLASSVCPVCSLGLLLEGSLEGDLEALPARDEEVPGNPESIEFGRYTLKRRLASGGMGVVYEAEDRKLKRPVALKMIRGSTFADEAELARFTIEAEAAAGLDHPHIVPIYEVGRLEGQPFFTMKLIEGQSLAERLKKSGGALPPREAATLLSSIARAVHHAHQRGVLHRDLKPGNILIDNAGVPWLTDFGLAKITTADSCLTLTTDHLGTPHYMSPEVAGGRSREVSTASDVWALGVILWEVLCGAPPFHGAGPVEIMRRIVEHEPSWSGGGRGDEDLVTLARRCMEKEPARRPVSAGEVAEELERWLRGEPIRARRITRRERCAKWVKRKPALAALYAALALGGVGSFVFWQRAEKAVISLTQTNDQLGDALRLATATKLAGDARLEIKKDPARALLLAVEAVEATQRREGGVLPEASAALYEVLQQAGGQDISLNKKEKSSELPGFVKRTVVDSNNLRISPDGRWLLALDWEDSSKNGIVASLFDLRGKDKSTPSRRWQMWPTPGAEVFRGFCWLGDSRRILSVSESGEIRLWNAVESGEGPSVKTPGCRVIGNLEVAGLKFRSASLRASTESNSVVIYGNAGVLDAGGSVEEEGFLLQCLVSVDSTSPLGPVHRIPFPRELGSRVTSSISPDGKWHFTGGTDRKAPGYLRRINADGPVGEPVLLPEGEFNIGSVVFSPNSRWMVIVRSPALARVYDLSSGDAVKAAATGRVLADGVEGCTFAAFSPDSAQVCMVGVGDLVMLQPVEPNLPPLKLRTAGGRGLVAGFSADGKWLFAGGHDRVVSVWQIAKLKDAEPPLEFRGLPGPVMNAAITPDAKVLLATGMSGNFRRWDFDGLGTGALPHLVGGNDGTVRDLAVSPDERWIAMACTKPQGSPENGEDGDVILAEPSGLHSWRLTPHHAPATGVAFSHDARWLASTGKDAVAHVYDFAAVQKCIGNGQPPPAPQYVLDMKDTRAQYDRCLAFHPRGTLYCTSGDGVLFEWNLSDPDPAAGRREHAMHTIHYLLPDVEVSPDGHWLAVGRHGWDREPVKGSKQRMNMVLLYNVSKPGPPVPHAELPATFLDSTNLTFTPDSRWLAAGSAGSSPMVWDLSASDPAATARGAPVRGHIMGPIAFSPDRPWLAMGGDEGCIYLWDWQSGTTDYRTITTSEPIRTLHWLSGGRLISGGNKGQAGVWETDIPNLVALARKVAGRELTEKERNKFRISWNSPFGEETRK
ncbi:MAG TPA: WD40 repeat domain-containing serine/threonine-protein kinase [Verrucomicrobiales bacterium]|nr:WD40 repeat domain-containing serine/threonine-protein kinase [Verrucomicrobiales bacterium]